MAPKKNRQREPSPPPASAPEEQADAAPAKEPTPPVHVVYCAGTAFPTMSTANLTLFASLLVPCGIL